MRNKARILVAAAAATTVMGLAVPGATAAVSSSSQAPHTVSAKASRWHCTGKKMKRCITKVAENKVKVTFQNMTDTSVKGPYGIVCLGPGGQWFNTLHKGSIGAHESWASKTFTCKKRFNDGARGFKQTYGTGPYLFTPTITI